MINFNYNSKSGEFTKATFAAIDPLETKLKGELVYLLPANATDKLPPNVQVNEVALFKNNEWVVSEDYRGTMVYDKLTCEPYTIKKPGEMPVVYTQEIPPFTYSKWDYKLNSWVEDVSKKEHILQEKLIASEMRKLAIDSLKVKGELPTDFKETLVVY